MVKTFGILGLGLFLSFSAAADPQFIPGPPAPKALALVQTAKTYLGTPYVLAGTSHQGVDCSGFLWAAYQETFHQEFPASVFAQAALGDPVEGPLLPGDLVFFNTTGVSPSHVGIYLGNQQVIHAASQGGQTGVIVSSLTEAYYQGAYLYSRRIFNQEPPLVKSALKTSPAPWNAPEKIKAPGAFDLEIATNQYHGKDLIIEVYHQGTLQSRRRRNMTHSAILDRVLVPRSGTWDYKILTPTGTPLTWIRLQTKGKP